MAMLIGEGSGGRGRQATKRQASGQHQSFPNGSDSSTTTTSKAVSRNDSLSSCSYMSNNSKPQYEPASSPSTTATTGTVVSKAQRTLNPKKDAAKNTFASLVPLLNTVAWRDKNQHSRASWWRHFESLRSKVKVLDKLCESGKRRAAADLCADLLEHHIESWHRGFAPLATDLQFAELGQTLLAVAGKVHSEAKSIVDGHW